MMSLSPELLAALRAASFLVSQHRYTPCPDEWFAGIIGPTGLHGGDVGPYEREAALVGGVAWMVRLLDENIERADAAEREVLQLSAALKTAQAELRAERDAKGRA